MLILWDFGSVVVRLTEPAGSVVRPNLTEPLGSAEPEPEPNGSVAHYKFYYLYLVYSTLTVKVLKEEHVYDFATALVAIGGSMGLLLGYSCNSLFSSLLDLIEHYCMERIHQVK